MSQFKMLFFNFLFALRNLNNLKIFTKFIVWVTVSLLGCASSLPRIKDVIELAPPQHVRMTKENGQIKISWDRSPHENQPQFEGYNVYYATKSLILASVKDLPMPVVVDKYHHETVLTNLEKTSRYFVHVRSRDKDGTLSFPSLPELVIKPNSSL